MAAPTASTAAQAWACRSRAIWRSCWVGPSTCTARRARAASSPWSCPRSWCLRRLKLNPQCRWRRLRQPTRRHRSSHRLLQPPRCHPWRPPPHPHPPPSAARALPSAVVLDVTPPAFSGLGVLDQLKRTPAPRHIPVHVVSVADYSQEALGRGAVGYALKPVKRDELVHALQRLEAKFTQNLRRVLVVEDDERQRESVRHLLTNDDVEIVGAGTAAEALAHLRGSTFDCMVMDLNLPDLSGYELLQQMTEQDGVSFPPVIVYTGRALSRDEEQQLRRFSKSIIIKDARSPERLLDEVTLFLHQVESELSAEHRQMLQVARNRETALEGRNVLVVEDDVRNVFALSSILEPTGIRVEIARNGLEALQALERAGSGGHPAIDLVLMDIMMPEMDGYTAMREIRNRPEWRRLPIIALTAKAMKDDQEKCLAAGANDYIAKPLDVEKLLSLVRVWMPK